MNAGVTGKWINPSVEHLAAKYLDCRNVVELLKKQGVNADVIIFCETQLDEVKTLLKSRWRRKTTLIWQLLHRVSEQLILVMGAEELAAQGHKILQDLKIGSVPDNVRTDWIIKIDEKVKELEKHLADSTVSINLAAIAQLFKTASNVINECTDDRFWDISVRKYFAFIYGNLLLLTGIILFVKMLYTSQFCLTIFNILLIGAIGGLVSGLITSDQEYMSKGHFWIPTFYYALVRPSVGAVAAVVVFWMVESHYLIQVVPQLRNKCVESTCERSYSTPANTKQESKGSLEVVLQNISAAGKKSRTVKLEAAKLKKMVPFANRSSNSGEGKKSEDSLVTLKSVEGKQIYMYLLLLFFAGFSGDKLLKSVSCKLNTKMFAEAEKTKETKK
jgi:hypothetical protein